MTPDFHAMVETRFRDLMQAQYPNLPLFFSNTPGPDTEDTYVEFYVIASDDTIPINLGGKAKSRNVGLIQIDVFTPTDIGAGEAKSIAHFAGNIFKRQVISVTTEGVATFKDSTVQNRGKVRGRHKHMARVPYRYDFDDI